MQEFRSGWADAAAGIDQRTVCQWGVVSVPRYSIVLQVSEANIEIDEIMRRTAAQPRRRSEHAVQRISDCVVTLGGQPSVTILSLVRACRFSISCFARGDRLTAFQ
jgi:hypothetical protein